MKEKLVGVLYRIKPEHKKHIKRVAKREKESESGVVRNLIVKDMVGHEIAVEIKHK
jgi:hypothetical protein